MTDDEAIELLTTACRDVLEDLRAIDLSQGTAIERMGRLHKLTTHGGGFDKIKDKLVQALTKTHPEARYGNFGVMMPRGPGIALGHTVSALDYLRPTSLEQNSKNLERARDHLRQALHSIK